MQYTYFAELQNTFFLVFLVGTLLNTAVEAFVDWTNTKDDGNEKKLKRLHAIHPLAKKLFSRSKIEKSRRYNLEKASLWDMFSSVTSTVALACVMLGVAPFALHSILTAFPGIPVPAGYVVVLLAFSALKTAFEIPFSHYGTFTIEDRWGFNRTDGRTFYTDMLKGFLISSATTCVLVPVLDWLLTSFGRYTPWRVCGLVLCLICAEMLIEFLWMTVIIRLFNRLQPLKDGRLKRMVSSLLKRCGYDSRRVFVMDTSRRSSKANAVIGGFWKSKRIILFDTLLRNHTEDEVVAILGHELAHGKLHHLLVCRVISAVTLLATTFIAFSFIYDPRLYHAFGFSWIAEDNVVEFSLVGFGLAMTVIGSVKWILQPVNAWISRRMECAADRYSVKFTRKPDALATALMKLTSDSLGDVFPGETYEMWNNSHPSILKRLDALAKGRGKK